MSVPKEIFIVEGRDDTKRLIETFGPDVKTIETNGSAIPKKVQQQIQQLSQQFGIIILTDPDYQGERIRKIITRLVPHAKQAHLLPEQAKSQQIHASLGVEHAHPDAIRQAVENMITPVEEQIDEIPMSELIQLKLIGHNQASKRREYISQQFHLGHLNGKQLQKKLRLYGITLQQLQLSMQSYNESKK